MKAKGRPKGPEKVVYKRRVEPDKVPLLDRILSGDALRGLKDSILAAMDDEGESSVVPFGADPLKAKESTLRDRLKEKLSDEEIKVLTKAMMDDWAKGVGMDIQERIREDAKRANPYVTIPPQVESSPKSDVMALLEDIQRLTDELGSARMELEEVRLESENEKTQYWIGRALRAEKRVKEIEESL